MSDIPEINLRIKKIRVEKNLTLRAFADEIGYTHGTISSVEKGNTPVEKRLFVVVCAVFRVNENWLQTGEGEMFSAPKEKPQKETGRELAERYLLEKFRALSPELQDDVVGFCNLILGEKTRDLKKRLDRIVDVRRERSQKAKQ